MITTNTNGNPISTGLVDAIQSDSPSTIARFWYNGAELPCDIDSITVEKGSCGSDTFMVGEVIGDLLTATVKNLTTDIKGEKIECHIGYLVDGDYEYVSLGIFTVTEVKTTRYETYITAYSSVIADTSARLYTQGLDSPTILQLAERIASQMNCSVTFDSTIDTSLFVYAILEGITVYQALQIVAICSGGYVTNTNDGNVRIRQFSAVVDRNVDTGIMVDLPQIAEQPYEVESIGVMVSEATEDNEGNPIDAVYFADNPSANIIVTKQGSDYYLQDEQGAFILASLHPETADIFFSCSYMTLDIFKRNVRTIKGYTYSPATVGLSLGDPRLEGCDVLNVTDIDGISYVVPCHKLTHSYTGGFSTNVQSCDASDNANSIGTMSPTAQRFQNLSRETGTAQATANNAFDIANSTSQYFWFLGEGSDAGAHITETPREQFISDPENGGGNLLARSNGMAVRNGLITLADFSATGVHLYQNGQNVASFDADGMKLNRNGVTVANFSDPILLGNKDGLLQSYMELTKDGVVFGNSGYVTDEPSAYCEIRNVPLQSEYSEDVHLDVDATWTYTLAYDPVVGTSIAFRYAYGVDVPETFVAGTASSYSTEDDTLVYDGNKTFTHTMLTTYVSANYVDAITYTVSSGQSYVGGSFTLGSRRNAIVGYNSSALGSYLTASYAHQVVVGVSNDNQPDSLFEVGNGGLIKKSNALIVTQDGNIKVALNTSASSGTDHDLYQAINALGWASDVIE